MTKTIPLLSILLTVLAVTPSVLAQQNFEAGGLAVISAYRDADVVRSGATIGGVGFRPGPAGGLYFSQTMADRLGGEIRFIYAHNDLRVRSGGADADFAAKSYILNYDLLYYFAPRDAKVRPFVAGGGGMKVYQGTGAEVAFQPLSNVAMLTRTNETKGMLDFGAGLKVQLSSNAVLRVEVRDYVTEVPRQFATGVGTTFQGLMHHWAPAIGIGWTF